MSHTGFFILCGFVILCHVGLCLALHLEYRKYYVKTPSHPGGD
jgi:hypothetical protein